MALTPFSRSRSPVMSIRTQPEDETLLRAEIEAATRTQHELLPRYSWHNGNMRKEGSATPWQAHRLSHPKHLPSNDSASPVAINGAYNLDEAEPSYENNSNILRKPRNTSGSKKLWTSFAKRSGRYTSPQTSTGFIRTSKVGEKDHGRRIHDMKGNDPAGTKFRSGDQFAPVSSRSATRDVAEEQEIGVADLSHLSTKKMRRTLRKSVYGSITNTKSFFRSASRRPVDRLHNCPDLGPGIAPHVDSFENKDQLRDYLNNLSIVSPISPTDQYHHTVDTTKHEEPAELSAGPLPVELEDNSRAAGAPVILSSSCTEAPSVRDLPPYMEEKKFSSDIAKEQPLNHPQSESIISEDALAVLKACYTCNSCHRDIAGHEVYDFCAICDNGDRVLCTDCAERGPCCRHELEYLLRNPSTKSTSSTVPIDTIDPQRPNVSHAASCTASYCNHKDSYIGSERPCLLHNSSSMTNQACPRRKPLTDSSNTQDDIRAELNSAHSDLLKEISYVRREQDLVHQERELSLRARELEIRDQQSTLREREAILRQKNDQFVHNLQTLLSYQERSKHAFIGAQFPTSDPSHTPKYASEEPSDLQGKTLDDCPISLSRAGSNKHVQNTIHNTIEEADASIEFVNDNDRYLRSCAAQKRRKEEQTMPASSTSAAQSGSPEQQGKTVSRGNSERGASQDEEEDDEDSRRSPKKHKQDPSTPLCPQRLFACPYSKNDPARFSSRNTQERNYRGCGTHYLPDVSRLKQHLKRVHWQPEYFCPRCYSEFDTSAKLIEHAQAQKICQARDCPFPEKMDKTQQDKIHVKRPRVRPETVWFDIYKVLFPNSAPPDSPYAEDERITTPSSAVSPSAINLQATELLGSAFNNRLNQYDDLKPYHNVLQQALRESFSDLLAAYTLSPQASPGPGPSIVVSPVSRSSSGSTRLLESPSATTSRPAPPERKRSITNVVSQPQQVPVLQHPRPPRPKVNTALEVPHDYHRSPSTHSRQESSDDGSPDVFFDVPMLPHVQEDHGYDHESESFRIGDDRDAMIFIPEPPPSSSSRTKSIMSIDSGYGSGRSQGHTMPQTSEPTMNHEHIPMDADKRPSVDNLNVGTHNGLSPSQLPTHTPVQQPFLQYTDHNDVSTGSFPSYTSFLDPVLLAMPDGFDYTLPDPFDSPWNEP